PRAPGRVRPRGPDRVRGAVRAGGLQRLLRRRPALPGPRGESSGVVSDTALVVCGALGPEVKEVADRRGWDVDVYGVSALLHLYPDRIVGAVRERLRALRPRYQRLVVVYGDCGTFGKLEAVLEEFGGVRLP